MAPPVAPPIGGPVYYIVSGVLTCDEWSTEAIQGKVLKPWKHLDMGEKFWDGYKGKPMNYSFQALIMEFNKNKCLWEKWQYFGVFKIYFTLMQMKR